MGKKLKTLLTFFLVTLMGGNTAALASQTAASAPSYGKVVEIIDGDAVLVDVGDGRTAYVRLMGVDAMGRADALDYLRSELLGASVYLVNDASGLKNARFFGMYIYKAHGNSSMTTINELIIRCGFAKIRESDKNCGKIELLRKAEETARINKIGLWADSSQTGNYVYISEYVNINLCSTTDLADKLDSVSDVLAYRIYSRRQSAPFQKASDIKFVDGVSYDIFDKNRYRIVVSTNINTATESELTAIAALSASDVERILNYRRSYAFGDINELVGKNLISSSKFNTISRFIDVVDRYEITAASPDKRVNINTGSRAQLIAAGLPASLADYVINNRSQTTAYQSVSELAAKSSSPFTLNAIHNYTDNLVCFSDINSAPQTELESLLPGAESALITRLITSRPFTTLSGFASLLTTAAYSSIKDYIYCNYRDLPIVNINLATDSQLRFAGFSDYQISEIAKVRKKVYVPADLKLDLSSVRGKFTLCTNVNAASREELLTMSLSLDLEFIENLIYHRDSQPFGSYEELYDFFSTRGKSEVYAAIKGFLVLR